MGHALQQLQRRLRTIHHLREAASVLSWDQETGMPRGATESRAEQLSTLTEISHELFTSAETGRALAEAEAEVEAGQGEREEAWLVAVTRRDYEREIRLPAALAAEEAAATARAQSAWVEAKGRDDFSLFLPHLEKNLDLALRKAERYGYEGHPYDALLEGYEPGMRTSRLEALFQGMRPRLVELTARIREAPPLDASVLHQRFDLARQREFARRLAEDLGYDFERGRLDESEHPFCISFSSRDVRVTNSYDPGSLGRGLFGCLHEVGHALYEQGSPERFDHTPLEGGCSMGVHESQSRLWENFVGRSRGFWSRYLPQLKALFPEQLGAVDLDRFHRALNRVEPSLIRVEADEVTYNLHIMLRFELELQLLDGRLAARDLPQAWAAGMEELLGLTPPDQARGCLQDVHWSMGLFGYFPTYTLGNLLAAQLWEQAQAALGDLEEQFAKGDFAPLLEWLRERIHRSARHLLPEALILQATGRPLESEPFLAHLETKYGRLHGLA